MTWHGKLLTGMALNKHNIKKKPGKYRKQLEQTAIAGDITEQKHTKKKSAKHCEQLEEMLKERTRQLREADENLKIEVDIRKKAEKKLKDYRKQIRSLTSQMSLIEENEKRRIAAELHDCIGQPLALSKIKIGFLNKLKHSDETGKIIKEILCLIEEAIKETRTLTFELSPPILYESGLVPAVKWLIDQFRYRHGLNIILIDDGQDKPFDNNMRFFLFQAIRELLVNIAKHAQASKATIKMAGKNSKLHITIEDDGIGFSGPAVNCTGYGLFNIRERMKHINGVFEIRSRPGKGTRAALLVPFKLDKKLYKKELP